VSNVRVIAPRSNRAPPGGPQPGAGLPPLVLPPAVSSSAALPAAAPPSAEAEDVPVEAGVEADVVLK